MIRTLVIAAIVIACLYEMTVQSLAAAWFWGGFSTCERIFLLFPIFAILVGGISVLLSVTSVTRWISMLAFGAVLCAGVIGLLGKGESELLCGRPFPIEYTWIFFAVIVALGVWLAWHLPRSVRAGPTRSVD